MSMDWATTLYPLGNLDYKPEALKMIQAAGVPQLVNEYGWIWLWRNGSPSKLTVDVYKYYLGQILQPGKTGNFMLMTCSSKQNG